jgi:hypothetical protein
MKSTIKKILKENTQPQSNYQKVIDNFKRLLPDEYHKKLDEIFQHIRNFIEKEGFTLKVLNHCQVPFKGVRTRDFIIICSPQNYNSLAELVYIIFHEIRHEIQMGRLEQINPLSGDLEDFEELYRIYWNMEMDAHEYGLEWVDKIGKIINLPEKYYTLSPMVTNYPSMGHMVRNQIEYINKTIQDLKQRGYDYNDISDLPSIKNLLDKLDDLF